MVGITRNLGELKPDWEDFLLAGASPRASIGLLRAASAIAYLRERDHVIPEDIIEIAADVLRHRLILGYAARAANISCDDIIQEIIAQVPIP